MKLNNDIISIEVDGHGAELVSLKREGREYLWNGDARYWNRHAPILFPVVGKPCNNELHVDGKCIAMKQHGYARDSEFEELGDGRMRMVGNELSASYPYRLGLEVCYRLAGSMVEVAWTVENLDDREAYFQIGAHPGFMLPDYDPQRAVNGYVRFYDKEGRAVGPAVTSDLEDGNRVARCPESILPVEMPLTADTFARDAIIIEHGQVATVELLDNCRRRVLSVSCPQSEAYGVWAPNKEGCPFVCLEPWCGICDTKGFVDDISKRTYIHRLSPGEHYDFVYTITIG